VKDNSIVNGNADIFGDHDADPSDRDDAISVITMGGIRIDAIPIDISTEPARL
jgi:hypothetical protein